MEPAVFFLPPWPPETGPLLWIALAVVCAALAGESVRHYLGLPRITAYPVVGMLAATLAGETAERGGLAARSGELLAGSGGHGG